MSKSIKFQVRIMLLCIIILFLFPTNSYASAIKSEPQSSRIIVSMGDSYSAGEGITPFLGEYMSTEEMETRGIQGLVEFQDWLAHRSQNAWSGNPLLGNHVCCPDIVMLDLFSRINFLAVLSPIPPSIWRN